VRGISPAEGDVTLREGDKSVVGDGDAVSVGAEIAQSVFRSTEGPFGVDDPVVPEQEPEPGCKGPRFSKRGKVAEKLECTLMEGGFKAGDELTAKNATQHLDGKEEGAAGGDPAEVVWSEPAGGKYAVDMRMKAPTPTVP
jgi:hypothetical protein